MQDWITPLDPAGYAALNSYTTRGFTGHEHVDDLGIIHMNGRIYDPKLGRFLQADPFVQSLTFSQSLNRYSYGFNNPLNGTDPSGYFFNDYFDFVVSVINAFASLFYDQSQHRSTPPTPVNPYTDYATVGTHAGAFGRSAVIQDQASFTNVTAIEATIGETDSESTDGKFMNGAETESFSKTLTDVLNTVQTALDVAGLTPGVGIIPDAANAVISAARGNLADAGLSAAAMIPGVGQGVTLAKLGSKIAKSNGGLKAAARQIREAGTHPASRNQRVIAVGEDAKGRIFAGSSGGFDKGQRAAANALGIQRVPTRAGRHAEENLLDAVLDLRRVGTDALEPCPRCLPQLIERGVKIDK